MHAGNLSMQPQAGTVAGRSKHVAHTQPSTAMRTSMLQRAAAPCKSIMLWPCAHTAHSSQHTHHTAVKCSLAQAATSSCWLHPHAVPAARCRAPDLSCRVLLQNDLEFLRVRSARHEIMVAPSECCSRLMCGMLPGRCCCDLLGRTCLCSATTGQAKCRHAQQPCDVL